MFPNHCCAVPQCTWWNVNRNFVKLKQKHAGLKTKCNLRSLKEPISHLSLKSTKPREKRKKEKIENQRELVFLLCVQTSKTGVRRKEGGRCQHSFSLISLFLLFLLSSFHRSAWGHMMFLQEGTRFPWQRCCLRIVCVNVKLALQDANYMHIHHYIIKLSPIMLFYFVLEISYNRFTCLQGQKHFNFHLKGALSDVGWRHHLYC